jgi:hypothetical protein
MLALHILCILVKKGSCQYLSQRLIGYQATNFRGAAEEFE